MHSLFLTFAVCLFGLTVSQADELEDPEFVSVDFRVMRINGGDFEGIKVEAKPNEVIDLAFKRIQRSDLVEYSGPNPITFFREFPAPTLDDPDAVQRVPVAQYYVPPQLNEALFFFRSSRSDSAFDFEVIGMDDSLRAFPEDSVVTVNAANMPLYGKLGEREVVINTGANPAISYRSFINGEFQVGFAVKTEDGPKLVFENQLEFTDNYRVILMLTPPRREGSIRMNVYSIFQLLDDGEVEPEGA